jgi:hypothetical protein
MPPRRLHNSFCKFYPGHSEFRYAAISAAAPLHCTAPPEEIVFCEKPAAAGSKCAQTDKANATKLYVTDKNVRAIDNNYYTVTKETEARVRRGKWIRRATLYRDTCNYLAVSRDNVYFRP